MESDYGIERELSDLQNLRATYLPPLPPCLEVGTSVRVEFGDATTAAEPSEAEAISELFPNTYGQPLVQFIVSDDNNGEVSSSSAPMRVGVVFCGRQSPGGNNVVWGIYNALKTHNPNSVLLGFLGGSEGLYAQKTLEITDDILTTYKNQGGYDLLGRTKDQIRTIEQVNAAMVACTSLKLDGLIIIGGVTSNTDAAHLAETFAEAKCPTKVVGVPVTLNGDLKNQFVETNVGFDTVCKVNSQLISNVCSDALSAEKYYYFIRLMGRKASHVALECTLQSHPNMVIISEEVSASNLTLFDLTKQICDAVQARAEQDKYHGVILLPEGLIESIPEVYALLQEIHGLLEQGVSVDNISSQLSPSASALFECLPPFLRKQLLLHPESDDSAQLSQIETEKLFAHLVEIEMNKRLEEGTYKGKKFNAICHFFGYQARGSLPSKFDCDYAFVLGHVSYHILAAGLTGYLATVTNLKGPVNKWHCGAAPITAMMTVKPFRHIPGDSSPRKPALHPATVDLNGKEYGLLRQNAMKFLIDDVYRNFGPIQFDGPASDSKPATLCIEDQDFMDHIKDEEIEVDHVKSEASPPLDLDVNNQETTAAPPAESGDVPESHDKKEVINSELITNLETRENENVSEAAEYIQEEEEVEAAESVDIPESHNEEEAINSELVTNLESRKYDNVPEAIEAVENVQEDGQESFPASNPEEKEKEASITKNPCDSKIEDPSVQKNSSENDNNLDSPGDFTKPETEGVDILCSVNNPAEAEVEVEAPVTTYPCDCRIEDALVPNGSPENDILDSVNNPVDAEEEDEASVTIYPCDCRIEYADVNNDSSKNDNILHLSGDLTKPKTEGGDLLDSVNNPVEAEEEKEEEALETKYPCDCRIEDEAVQNESSENDNNLHLSGDVTKPETEGDDLLGSVNNVVVDGEEELLIKNPSACDIQDADIKKDPSDNNNNNLHLPEIEGGELLCPDNNAAAEEEEALLIKDPSACDIQDADVPKNPSDNINNNNLHSLESEGDELLCPVNNTVGAEEEEEASETKDLMIPLKDSSENENNLHSPDDSMKPETEEGDLLCPVNAAEVKIQFTRVSDKVEEILKATEISDSSCHANGGPVHDVTSSAVAITNGGNLFSNNAAVLSQPPVQFGSFVPTVYQVNGGSGDNSIKKIISPDVKGLEHVRKSDVPKPSPSLEIEEALAVEVESVKRPFNYLIKMPKFYDDELNDQIRKGEVQVSEKTQKRDDIKYKMQTIRENMHHARNNLTDRVSEERAARRLIKLKRQEIDAVQSIINRVKNAISVDDIDARIKHMEHMMQHETLALKEEKQFIREIKQMKLCREQLSSNIGSQDEVEQRDQIEDKLKILKKDLERLKSTVSAAEATVIEADKKFKDEKKKLQEVYAQHGAAQDDRQEAYMKLQNLRKQYYDKNACWRRYKDDSAVASDYSLSGDKGALHRLCLNQVEKMMELWNNDDEFRKEYIRCNTRSTLWRLKTLDGRALGPDEEPPVFSNFIGEKTKSYNYKVAQASPSELTIVSAVPDKKEKPIPTKEAAVTKELKSEEKVAEKAKKADKDKKLVVSTMKNNSSIIKSLVGNVEKSEEVIIISKHDDDDDDNNNNKQKREEEEAARKEEQRRKAEEEAKLKELKRLEEIAKAKEALERKRKIAEKAQIRAEARAQKEAELKDKEKEKRAKKKERKKTGGGADSEGGEREKSEPVSGLTVETTLMESETNKEIHPLSATEAATASKKQQKAFKKHQTKLKSISAMPEPLRNKNKKRMQQWIWIIVTVGVVAAVVLLGNLGFYPNNLGGRGNNNRHPGF